MIRSASRDDLPRIRQLLSRANDTPYDLVRFAEEKCFGAGFEGQPEVRVFGEFEAISVTCGKHLRILAVDRARRRRGIGSELLQEAESRGARVVAAEPGNYFVPGILETMVSFFAGRGYRESARTNILVADLAAIAPGGGAPPRAEGRDRERVLEFIEHEFGAIWRFEASRGTSIFYVQDGGDVGGFSTHDANNRGLGFFGPTGVAKSMRGRGLGRQLLLASLADLRAHGYAQAVIPWTEAVDFYQKSCGARVAHRLVIVRRIAP